MWCEMARVPQSLLVGFVAALLGIGAHPSAVGWHWEDEEPYTQFRSQAGDPRVLEDAGACLEETDAWENVSCTVLYFHFYGSHDKAMNKQRQPDCLGAEATGSDNPTAFTKPAKIRLDARLAEYTDDDGEDTCNLWSHNHPWVGTSGPVRPASSGNITVHWYMSHDQLRSHLLETDPIEDTGLGSMPCLTVHATLQNSVHQGSGQIIAEGETTKTVLTAPSAIPEPGLDDPCPGSTGPLRPEEITEFRIELGPSEAEFPMDQASLFVDWYQWDPDGAGQLPSSQGHWNTHTGPEHPARLVLPVEGATLRIDHLRLQEFQEKRFVHASINSTWGAYDVDIQNLRLELFDTDGQAVPLEHLEGPHMRYSTAHDRSVRPTQATFGWDLRNESLPAGTYTLRMTATDWQHFQVATEEIPLTIEDEEAEGAPGWTAVALLAVLLAVLLVTRHNPLHIGRSR